MLDIPTVLHEQMKEVQKQLASTMLNSRPALAGLVSNLVKRNREGQHRSALNDNKLNKRGKHLRYRTLTFLSNKVPNAYLEMTLLQLKTFWL